MALPATLIGGAPFRAPRAAGLVDISAAGRRTGVVRVRALGRQRMEPAVFDRARLPGVVYRVGSTEFPRRESALDDDGDDDDHDGEEDDDDGERRGRHCGRSRSRGRILGLMAFAVVGCLGTDGGPVMKRVLYVSMVVGVLGAALPVAGQAPAGALAIDERQGDQWGWAVDYETAEAARARALRECGGGCSVVLTFARCGAYAADQDADSTAVGWAESYESAAGARQAALSECRARGGGSGCVVRAWGCNGPVVEEGLRLDRASRRQIQLGLQAGGFDPGGADGLFGPRTRAAIRSWQTSRGSRATGYLDGAGAEALRTSGVSGPAVAQVARPGPTGATAPPPPAPPAGAASPPASAEFELVFWQSIANSTNPAEFEAYLEQFPNGVFRTLAQARLAAQQSAAGTRPAGSGPRVAAGTSGAGRPASGAPAFGGASAAAGGVAGPAAGGDAGLRPGEVFRDCEDCPEMVMVPAGSFRMGCVSGQDCWDDELPVHEVRVPSFALGRYEVLFEEYDRFVAATGQESPGDQGWGRGGRPVINVSWEDATAYAEWLSAKTGERYRLPSESEWEYAARAGTTTAYSWGADIGQNRANCRDCGSRWDNEQTAPAGSFAANAWGLHDLHGNVHEWVEDCWHDSYARAPADGSAWTRGGDCVRRVLRGGSLLSFPGVLRSADRGRSDVGFRFGDVGIRLARTLTP